MMEKVSEQQKGVLKEKQRLGEFEMAINCFQKDATEPLTSLSIFKASFHLEYK